MIRGIIFDLDGVIVSTDQFHYQAWKKIADELEIAFDETINNRLRGVSRMASLEIILACGHAAPLSQKEKEDLAARKNDLYRKLLENMTPLYVPDEIRETLSTLRERGYRISLASSSQNAPFILERTDLKAAFDAIVDGTMITRSKPDPEVFTKAASLLELPPQACLVVEDAKAGIEAAISGGMHSAAIADASKYGLAEYTLESLTQLLHILQ